MTNIQSDPTLAKTQRGVTDVLERKLVVHGQQRMLLVLADGTKTAGQLLGLVHGATQHDVDRLISLGMLTERTDSSTGPGGPLTVLLAPPASEPIDSSPVDATGLQRGTIDEKDLYASLTAMCRDQLGFLRAIKYALQIERACSTSELWNVAHRMLADIATHNGAADERRARRSLGLLTDPDE